MPLLEIRGYDYLINMAKPLSLESQFFRINKAIFALYVSSMVWWKSVWCDQNRWTREYLRLTTSRHFRLGQDDIILVFSISYSMMHSTPLSHSVKVNGNKSGISCSTRIMNIVNTLTGRRHRLEFPFYRSTEDSRDRRPSHGHQNWVPIRMKSRWNGRHGKLPTGILAVGLRRRMSDTWSRACGPSCLLSLLHCIRGKEHWMIGIG